MGIRLRLLGAVVAAALATGVLAASTGTVTHHAASPCGPNGFVLTARPAGGPTVCAHADEAPAGVDVHEPVSTADLRARNGASAQALAAAEEAGVASPTDASSSSTVPCDGDGTTGYRVQPMYVVEAGRQNRFATLDTSFQRWAAGVDDVINRSAALTGGVRDVRFVTDPATSGGGCVAHVLNVTVPSGSLTDFNSTINAVAALGYKDPHRKYLMWVDASNYCGIATLYTTDTASQTNANNGYYPQYARIDSGCWGFGDGAYQHSVEAHELTHNLGAVLDGAPHSTSAGHCWDESDTMCYPDGGNHGMVQVCPTFREYLLDCGSDDYFSTSPAANSWLATHWNVADSRFLIGGGDGHLGAQTNPTSLGAQLLVNNPAVPGLATQVEVNPILPSGDAVRTVSWRVARAGCIFANPRAESTLVTCNASAYGSTTVTVTVTDTAGDTKTTSSPLAFSTGGPGRAVTIVAGLRYESGRSQSACRSAPTLLSAGVFDRATGRPVKGVRVHYWLRTGASAAAHLAASSTYVNGSAGGSFRARAGTLRAASTAIGVFKSGSSPAVSVSVGVCTSYVKASADRATTYPAGPVVLTGAVRRVGGVPLYRATVSVVAVTTAGRAIRLGAVRTGVDGGYRIIVHPTVSGRLLAYVAATRGWTAARTSAGWLTVKAR